MYPQAPFRGRVTGQPPRRFYCLHTLRPRSLHLMEQAARAGGRKTALAIERSRASNPGLRTALEHARASRAARDTEAARFKVTAATEADRSADCVSARTSPNSDNKFSTDGVQGGP